MSGPVRVAVVGAGDISDQYLKALAGYPDLAVTAVADLVPARARAQAEAYGVPAWGTTAEVLRRDDVDLVVNLTVPAAHAEVALAAIAAGKHVWGEKPLALDRASARAVLDAAHAAGVVVGNAPDTVLGPGVQTSHRLLAEGAIGEPMTVLTLMQGPGPDLWHPRPQFLFAKGAGPLFDIGPYYLTALAQVFGPVRRVTAAASTARPVRVIGSGPRAGAKFDVTVPSHHSALIEFECGASAQTIFSFESHRGRAGLEIYGSTGTIAFPDPNTFEGDSLVFDDSTDSDGRAVPAVGSKSTRGTGVAEMAQAVRAGRPERATGAQAFHVLDIMVSITESANRGESVTVESSFERAPVVPVGWDPTVASL